jgi:hypothetical protein
MKSVQSLIHKCLLSTRGLSFWFSALLRVLSVIDSAIYAGARLTNLLSALLLLLLLLLLGLMASQAAAAPGDNPF